MAFLPGPAATAHRLAIERLRSRPPATLIDDILTFGRWKAFLKGFFDFYGERSRLIVMGSSRLDIYRRGGGGIGGSTGDRQRCAASSSCGRTSATSRTFTSSDRSRRSSGIRNHTRGSDHLQHACARGGRLGRHGLQPAASGFSATGRWWPTPERGPIGSQGRSAWCGERAGRPACWCPPSSNRRWRTWNCERDRAGAAAHRAARALRSAQPARAAQRGRSSASATIPLALKAPNVQR
jgi:hypothetical protein